MVSACARATEILLCWLGEEDLQLSMPYEAVGISRCLSLIQFDVK